MDCSRGRIKTSDQISIDIKQPDEDLLISIRNEMEKISYSHCICKVEDSLRQTNAKAYTPDIVSIGPYHHKKADLQVTEVDKWRYMHALLNRKPNLEASLDDCVTALTEVEHRARSCYADCFTCSPDDRHGFLKMMLVDGCFIIELFFKYSIKSLRRRNDRIFNTLGMLFDLRCNLILLENQIPLFVLERLFQVVPIPKQWNYPFPELAFRFFRNMIPGDPKSNREKFNQEAHHLLDIICHCLLPTYPRAPKPKSENKPLPCATELLGSGIRIKTGRTNNILDIKFGHGVLEIPPIFVHQYTESLFRNLIALEHCCSADSMQTHYITSYAIFMKMLLKTDRDTKFLHQSRIVIDYDPGTEREVDKLFDELCKGVNVKDFYFDGLCEQVNGYKGNSWHLWHKRIKHGRRRSSRNPQLRLRLVLLVALLALLLTIVGTSFSIITFFLRSSKKS